MKIKAPKSAEIIVITGPESSGKTTLANRLHNDYGIPLVTEFARLYLEQNGPKYDFKDLEKIALCQNIQEKQFHEQYPKIICDTDFITVDIWAKEKFGKPLSLKLQFENKKHYLLSRPDIRWEEDPLRENPDDRDRLFAIYESYLNKNNLSYEIVDNQNRNSILL